MIPSAEECFRLMKQYEMLDNIRAHSMVVEKIATVIARGLRDAGVDISLEKITAGALMHDIGKTICFNTGGDHAALGEEICLQHKLDEIADIVSEHVSLKSYAPDLAISEKEIVYYADKRVNHDEVVALEERLEYLFISYGNNEEYRLRLIKENMDLCREVEKKLFTKLNFRPEELAGMIE
jgi:putative nucleotidyltransferase with HDIG domain